MHNTCSWLVRLGVVSGALFGLTFPALAQTATLEGTVRDASTGAVIRGVAVSIPNTRIASATDSLGHYRIANLPYGMQRLTAERGGYVALTILDFNLNKPIVTQDITMRSEAPFAPGIWRALGAGGAQQQPPQQGPATRDFGFLTTRLAFKGDITSGANTSRSDGNGSTVPGDDPLARFLFPPELVMAHQQEIGLTDRQRSAIADAMKEAQGNFVDLQFILSAEVEKLQRLTQATAPDEAKVLGQMDRVLAPERDVKRAQLALLIRIKDQLTEQQQAALAKLRQ